MKKIMFILLLTIIGYSGKIIGQNNCLNAQLLSFNDSVKTIYMESSEYWLYFVADTNYFKLGLKTSNQNNALNISSIQLYENNNSCLNLILRNQINLQTGDSVLKFQTIKGITYMIKFSKIDTLTGNLSFYNTNKIGSQIPMNCGPQLCQINANGNFNDLSNDLIDALFAVSPTPTQNDILLDPLSDPYSSCCNWYTYLGSPQIVREGTPPNFNYYMYMWAYSTNGNLSSESAYNRLVGTTVLGNSPGLIAGQNYIINLNYRERGAGVSGFRIFFANENSQGIISSSITQVIEFPLNTLPNTIGFVNKSFLVQCNGNFNVVIIRPYQNNAGIGVTLQGGLDIDDFVISSIPQIINPIISGNPNNCTTITSYSVSNPQSCVNYNWVISPSSSGTIISGQGTTNITVEWKNLTACENTLSVTASSPGTSSISTVMNIYSCCTTFPTQLNNVSNLTTSYANQRINVNGNLYITGNVTFNNCDVYLSPYSKIIVEQGANLSLINGTVLTNNRCCEIMWDGIYLSSNTSTLTATSSSSPIAITYIENSINGIVANNNTNLFIVGVRFTNNATSINIKNYLPNISNVLIKLNYFNGGALKKPYLGYNSKYGIKVENADNVPIGSSTGGAGNYFNKLFCGIYGLNSYMKINSNHFTNIDDFSSVPYQCQSLTNPLLVCKPTAIHSAHTFANNQTFINAPKKVEIGYTNTFDNCINGIKVYNEKAIISSNIVRAVTNAIDVLDPLNYSVINNNIVENCANGTYPYMGIRVWKTQPALINVSVYSNSVKSRYTGIFVGNCKSQRLSNMKAFYVDINNNTVKITNDALRGMVVQNCPSVFVKCNNIDKNTTTALTGMKHGISVETTINGEIQQNHVKFMGAGINVYGCSDLTQFYCNTLESDFYGFLFNQHASITNQGTEKIRTDNQWTPMGNYHGYYQGQPVERKLWKLNANFTTSNVDWYVYNTSYSYHPDNYSPNPTQNLIFPHLADIDAITTCNQNCPPSSIKEMTLEEREEKFGAIVRNELEYPDLNEQFREYNRYILYQTLKENPWIMTMGGADDYMYQDFFNDESNGNIGKFDALETLIAEGNIDQALVKNGQIIDSTLIAYNQRVVNDIYLNTFARDSYELTPAQYQTLYDIATNYTPWEGGEGVYIARYMLGIDIDYSNPNVQFSKGDGGIAEAEMLSVFPNPASNSITLSFANAIDGGFVVDVYNHTGSKVLTETISQTQAQYQLNTAKLKNGIYFISVRNNTETFKSKFTIIK